MLQIFAIIDDTSVMNFRKKLQHNFPKMRGGGGGSKAVWNFSENSSVLEGECVPYNCYNCFKVANEEAQKRKNGLSDNLEAWKNFEEKRLDGSRMLDMADAELKSLRKNYNMERAPVELQEKVKVAVTMRFVTSC